MRRMSIIGRSDRAWSSYERSPSRNRAMQWSIEMRLTRFSPRTTIDSALTQEWTKKFPESVGTPQISKFIAGWWMIRQSAWLRCYSIRLREVKWQSSVDPDDRWWIRLHKAIVLPGTLGCFEFQVMNGLGSVHPTFASLLKHLGHQKSCFHLFLICSKSHQTWYALHDLFIQSASPSWSWSPFQQWASASPRSNVSLKS